MTAGEVVHGSAAEALRGCDCGDCRRRLVELAGEPPAQLELELPFPAVPGPAGGAPRAARRGVVLLPAGLAPVLPPGVDPIAGSQARQEVLAEAASTAEAARQLLARGLAVPSSAVAGWPGGLR